MLVRTFAASSNKTKRRRHKLKTAAGDAAATGFVSQRHLSCRLVQLRAKTVAPVDVSSTITISRCVLTTALSPAGSSTLRGDVAQCICASKQSVAVPGALVFSRKQPR